MLYDKNTYMHYRQRRCVRCSRPAMPGDTLCGVCHNHVVMATMPRYNPRPGRKRTKKGQNQWTSRHINSESS